MLQKVTPEPVAGRPRAFDEDNACDAALELFWKRGYQSTTTRDLESALGLSQSSIYNAFGSKRGLFLSALLRYEALITRDLLEPLETSSDGLEAIDGFFKSLGFWVTHDGRRGCMLVNLMAEDGGATDEITSRLTGYRRRVRSALRSAFRRSGSRDSATNDARADLLVGLVLGINVAARGGAPSIELRRMISGARRQIGEWIDDQQATEPQPKGDSWLHESRR